MATSIVGDDPIPVLEKKQHLGIPVVGRQGPSVMKSDRLGGFRTPVLIEDVDAVFGLDEMIAHDCSSLQLTL